MFFNYDLICRSSALCLALLAQSTLFVPNLSARSEIVNDVETVQQKKSSWVTLSGKVNDENGDPLPGVTVTVPNNRQLGTTTDVDGKWELLVPENTKQLRFSFIGMQPELVNVKNGKREYNVTIREDANMLEQVEVVATGYGEIDRKRLTSAVTTVKMDDINIAGIPTVDKMLEGNIPGMIFMQSSGQVGAAPKLRIRGSSSVLGNQEPLWVLDGVILHDPVNVDPAQLNDLDFVNLLGNAISGLNPDDIEQIDVLKDAAATAIYGTRAANGVIVITTKKGQVGAPRVSYAMSGTFQRRPHYSDRTMYLMNSKQRVDVSREMFERGMSFNNISNWVGYEGAYMDYKNGKIDFNEFSRLSSYYETVNTDWLGLLTENSFSQKHSVNVSGGTNNVHYYASLSYNDNNGVIKGESNDSYTAMMKLDGSFKRFTYRLTLNANTGKNHYIGQVAGGSSVLQYAYDTNRALPAYNADGTPYYYLYGSNPDYSYPLNIEREMQTNYNDMKTYSTNFQANLKYRIFNPLTVETTLSYAISNTSQENVREEDSYYIMSEKGQGRCPFGGEMISGRFY